ncbi:MAG: hypothetical protein IJA08_03310 [Clostridia bacterium]|nr:hypothetical protein [Clostridia bacterium]
MLHFDQSDAVLSTIAAAFAKRLKTEVDLELKIDPSLGELTGKIEDGVISAGSHGQLCDAAGRFLRNPEVRGTFTSHKSLCGMYFATHFANYYDATPLEEVYEYIEDLAFWGMSHFRFWFDMHHYRNMEEGKRQTDRLSAMAKHAQMMGMKIILVILANEAFKDSPKHLRADWTSGHDGYICDLEDHYHLEICPSKEGGMEQILSDRRKMLDVFAKSIHFDVISIGPYDEGGCTCPDCAPWGCNGYLRTAEALIPLIKEYAEDAILTLSTWQFGTFTGTEIEFEGMKKALLDGRLSEVKYIVAEPQYAPYPFREGMPRELINFPEISMFRANPWGGYGANPMPKHFQALWDKDGDKLGGGWPYSEGLYEDINKVIMLRFYRDNQKAEDTVREYMAYEFGLTGELLEKASQAIMDMDDTLERDYDLPFTQNENGERFLNDPKTLVHRYVIKNPEKVEKIEAVIREVNDALPEEIRTKKKWRLIYLRAVIDGELKRNDYYRNETVLGYFKELERLSNLQNSGIHVRPDIFDENSKRELLA